MSDLDAVIEAYDVLEFWGKAQQSANGDRAAYHPVAFHSLDVAACIKVILEQRPITRARLAWLLGVSESAAVSLLVAITALHDIGKFGIAFQAKRPDLWPTRLGSFKSAAKSPHTADGYLLWDQVLADDLITRLWAAGADVLHALAPSIFGHHGRPVACPGSAVSRAIGTQSVDAARTCALAMVELLLPEPISVPVVPDTNRSRIAGWWIAGLVTLADWIGSHEEWFEYESPDAGVGLAANLNCYWMLAQERAHIAIRAAGLIPPQMSSLRSFTALTRIDAPSPAQEWASNVTLPEGPVLVIIEDVTGSGKTEAAQMLVHRLMVSKHASGAYWAMPTQATANAMYTRQADAISALFDENTDQLPSLALAHGQSRLHKSFRGSVLGDSTVSITWGSQDSSDSEPSSTASCAAFLADDRRTSLLADIGAGTIDQAILGVLPSRFNTLRLFALSEKVLVIDEAHAYDAYVTKELESLLKFHAALGGSTIVLSATLAMEQRAKLVDAWMDGASRGEMEVERPSSMAYPLATVVSATSAIVEEKPVVAAPRSHREVAVRFVHSEEEVVNEIVNGEKSSATIAWVRNSVGDCIRAARTLRDLGLDPIVFHARFAQCDRQARERDILERFGRDRKVSSARRVVVATQVLEQSLDVDFDMMFSDVAPIDLLIQRAGRLQRHPELNAQRPIGLKIELVILAPQMEIDPPEDWLKALLPATAHVYDNTGVIWRTVRALSESHRIKTPGEMGSPSSVRGLVEAVYGDDFVPPRLEGATIKAEGHASAARATATYGTLSLNDGYNAHSKGWVDDIRVPTRLGKEQTVIRLARVLAGRTLAPWARDCDEEPSWKQWALSEVRVPARYIPQGAAANSTFATEIARIRQTWGKYEQEIPVLPLEAVEECVWAGFLSTPKSEIRVVYTIGDGLSVG